MCSFVSSWLPVCIMPSSLAICLAVRIEKVTSSTTEYKLQVGGCIVQASLFWVRNHLAILMEARSEIVKAKEP